MPDRIAYPALVLLAAGLIALAMVWPQGVGAPSPAPFGHPLAPLPAATPSAQADSPSLLGMPAASAPAAVEPAPATHP